MPKARQTCTECSMRRQKCDRQIPCGRCVRRGQADKCTRDWPKTGYNPQVHRTYPRPSSSSSSRDGRSIISANSVKDSLLLSESLHMSSSTIDPSSPKPKDNMGVDPLVQSPDGGGINAIREPRAALQFYAWGQENLSDYNLRSSVELQRDLQLPINPDCDPSFNGLGDSGVSAQVSFLQRLLPKPRQVIQMVDYHLDNIFWHHGIFHGPTFQNEVKNACGGPDGLQIRNMDLRWAALLFSVLTSSIVIAPASTRLAWGITEAEVHKLTPQLYKAGVTCLNLGNYISRHHIYTLEAICILNLSAHIIGFNSTQSSLLGAALKIAQGLGLHKLGREDDERFMDAAELKPAHRTKIIQREIGRRIWAQLCMQDWFGTPFLEMYSIQRLHFSTIIPNNIDENTLEVLPSDQPSYTSMCNMLLVFATFITDLHDDILRSNTLMEKYEKVLQYDANLRALVSDQLSPVFDSRKPVAEGWPHWVPWARRCTRTCYAHKIIMIHRPFLSRSFIDPTFAYSRDVCLDSSKMILREIKQASEDNSPLFWVDQAHMIAAGITLVLDIFHRKDDDPRLAEHRRLVDSTIAMLGKFDNSTMCTRGVKLLSSLLMEHARMSANTTLENYRRRDEEEESNPLAQKRQRFNLPRFVNNFAGAGSFTQLLKGEQPFPPGPQTTEPQHVQTDFVADSGDSTFGEEASLPALEYEKFEELFPPLAGISNHFLFEDLLDFEM